MAKSAAIADKAALREQAFKQRAGLSAQERAEAAREAAKLFLDTVSIGADQIVSCYWPIRDELDSKPLLTRLMDDGRNVCLPVVMGADVALIFRRWELGAALYPSGFGTLAPAEGAEVVEPDIIIIPMLGFDKTGTRLGFGKGHYDRTIAGMRKKPMLVGYAFAAQELQSIPREAHDVPLDLMITEAGVTRF